MIERMFILAFLAATGFVSAASAQEAAPPPCYWCMRDAIYADISLINRLEADPDIDDAVRGPQIVAARADIRRLRLLLGPVVDIGAQPCCYGRPRLVIR